MFVANSSKGSGFKNGAILFVIVLVAATVALLLVKQKKDPKDPEATRNTLGFGKKKV